MSDKVTAPRIERARRAAFAAFAIAAGLIADGLYRSPSDTQEALAFSPVFPIAWTLIFATAVVASIDWPPRWRIRDGIRIGTVAQLATCALVFAASVARALAYWDDRGWSGRSILGIWAMVAILSLVALLSLARAIVEGHADSQAAS